MRENRTCGSEGGEGNALPDPYHDFLWNLKGLAERRRGWPGQARP